jgi:hypothetical protein
MNNGDAKIKNSPMDYWEVLEDGEGLGAKGLRVS